MSFHLAIVYEAANEEEVINLEVSRLHTTGEICQSVYKKLKSCLCHELSCYGLFSSDRKTWLQDRPIGRELKGTNQANLQFRLKIRPVVIRFLDASTKTLTIDETQSVKNLVKDICTQLNIPHPEQLSLVVAVDFAVDKHHPANNMERKSPMTTPNKDIVHNDEITHSMSPKTSRQKTTNRPGSAGILGRLRSGSNSSINPKKQISRRHQIRIDTPWLDPCKTLREQDVTEDDELLLMYRFHYYMELDSTSESVEMLFKQARANFLSGEMSYLIDDIPKFTALLCQILYGDFVSKEDTQEKLHRFKKVLLPPKQKSKGYAKDVAACHLLLTNLKVQEAMCWFLKLWSSTEVFGMEFFSCINLETKEKGLVGVSKAKVVFLHHNTKKKSLKLNINTITMWQLHPEIGVVSLMFTVEGVQMKVMLQFPGFYASIFVDCLQGNQEISSELPSVQLIQKEYCFNEEIEKQYTRYSAYSSSHKIGSQRHKRSGSLTLKDVLHLNEAVEAPLVSQEERESWSSESWENPVFVNLDQLMDERFSFLDFETDLDDTKQTLNIESGRQKTSSIESSPSTEKLPLSSSPLVISNHKLMMGPSPLTLSKFDHTMPQTSGIKNSPIQTFKH